MAEETTTGNSMGHSKLAAIMFTDMVGYSALMQKNESLAIELVEEHRRLLRSLLPGYRGIEIETVGDAFLLEFESAIDAVRFAIEIQKSLSERNLSAGQERSIQLRIGIHLGDVVHKENRVYGDGVNIASRIQSMAQPGGINISGSVFEQTRQKFNIRVLNLGKWKLKNIESPIKIYRVITDPAVQNLSNASFGVLQAKTLLRRRKTKFTIGIGFGSAALLVLAWLYFRQVPPPNSIAVVPFEYTGDDSIAYIAGSITNELIQRLYKLQQEQVVSIGKSIYFKSAGKSESEIAHELNVRLLVGGSISTLGEQVNVYIRLTEPDKNKTLWDRNIASPKSDLPQLQYEIPRAVASSLRQELSPRGHKTARSVDDLFENGLSEVRKYKRESNDVAISYFIQCIEQDSSFARAYVELANAQLFNIEWGWNPDETWLTKAEENCQRALRLDSSVSDAYGVLGRVYIARGEQEEGMNNLVKSIQLNKNDISSLAKLGEIYALHRNDAHTAVYNYFIRARDLDPFDPINVRNLAVGYALLKQNPEAERLFNDAIKLKPSDGGTWIELGEFYKQQGLFDSAISKYMNALRLDPNESKVREYLAELLIATGKLSQAEYILEGGLQVERTNYLFLYMKGLCQNLEGHYAAAKQVWEMGYDLVEKDMEKNKGLWEPRLNLGLLAARLKEVKNAITRGREAYDLNPQNSDIVIGLARIYAILGQKQEMIEWFKRAKTMAPDFNEIYLKTALDFENYRQDQELLKIARE